jgi:hypothetical protein
MKLGKVGRLLKEMPWLRGFFLDGEVFRKSSLHEKQFVTYIKRQLGYISIRPFASLDLSDASGHSHLGDASRAWNYAILWHGPGEPACGRMTWVAGDYSVRDILITLADAGESIFDAIVKEIKTTSERGDLQDGYQIFKIPASFSPEPPQLLNLGDDEDDEDWLEDFI